VRILAIAFIFFACAWSYAYPRDSGQWLQNDPEISAWFRSLMEPNPGSYPRSCCGESDAYYADKTVIKDEHTFAVITDDRDDVRGLEIAIGQHGFVWQGLIISCHERQLLAKQSALGICVLDCQLHRFLVLAPQGRELACERGDEPHLNRLTFTAVRTRCRLRLTMGGLPAIDQR